jgi:multiple sugar transport system permease protein
MASILQAWLPDVCDGGMVGGYEQQVQVPSPPQWVRPGRFRAWLDRRFAMFAVTPTVVVMTLVFGVPLLFSLYVSLRGWSIEQSLLGGRFVGVANYQDLASDPDFLSSLVVTLIYTASTVMLEMGIGLWIALLLNVDVPLIGMFRTVLVIPMMMTPIVAVLCWKLLLDADRGVVNYWLGQHIVWLGEPRTALLSISIVSIWQNAPYVALLLLAGLRAMPTEPIEAASIDGASRLQIFRHVILPELQPYLVVALLLRTIFEFRSFDNVYVMTGGGPANATLLLSMFVYVASFVQFDFSLAAAASWVMLIISMLLCLAFMLAIRRFGAR